MSHRLAPLLASLVGVLLLVPPAGGATPLDNAPVPSLCEHPAGTLVDGMLPGIPEGQGTVTLAANFRDGMIATGRIRDDESEMAAVLVCNRGGVGWPENIVFYSSSLQVMGHVDLFDITHGGRESVRRLEISDGKVRVDVENIALDGDTECCGSASARVILGWSYLRERFILGERVMYTDRKAVKRLLKAVRAQRPRATRRLASRGVARRLLDQHRDARSMRLMGCYGVLYEGWGFLESPKTPRACTVRVEFRNGDVLVDVLHVAKRGWNRFRVVKLGSIG